MLEKLNEPAVLLMAVPGLLIGLNAFLKANGMPSKFAPIVNLVGGFLGFLPLRGLGLDLFPAIIGSLMLGLAAGGFYDLQKAVKG